MLKIEFFKIALQKSWTLKLPIFKTLPKIVDIKYKKPFVCQKEQIFPYFEI